MATDTPARAERRGHSRTTHQKDDRPTFRLGSLLTTVIDTSEDGLRVLLPSSRHVLDLEVGAPVRGVLILHSRDVHVVAGYVVRIDGRVVVIAYNNVGAGSTALAGEQRWSRKAG